MTRAHKNNIDYHSRIAINGKLTPFGSLPASKIKCLAASSCLPRYFVVQSLLRLSLSLVFRFFTKGKQMKNFPVMSFFAVPVMVGLLYLCFAQTVVAQNEEAEKAEPTIEEKLAVPENASTMELEKFIREAQIFMPKSIKTYEQYLDFLNKQSEAINKAADLILASENLDVKSKRTAYSAKIRSCLQSASDEGSIKSTVAALQKILTAVQGDEAMKDVLANAEQTILQVRMNAFMTRVNNNRDEFKQLDKDIREYFSDGKQGASRFASTMLEKTISLYSEEADLDKIVDEFVDGYMALLSDAEKPRFEGLVRRIRLPGKVMEFETVTINVKKLIADADGKEDFDVMKWVEEQPVEKTGIKSLEGKVVLVDCWATWCGPCLGEIPNMLKQYEKYHEKGFEIVGYSCDSNLEALLKFVIKENPPWIIGSTVLSQKQEMENYLNYYGVSGIPTMILIGRDGKVISTGARGQTLNKLLEEQFAE